MSPLKRSLSRRQRQFLAAAFLSGLNAVVWLAGFCLFLFIFYGDSMHSPDRLDFFTPMASWIWALLCGAAVFLVQAKRSLGYQSLAGLIIGGVLAPPLGSSLPWTLWCGAVEPWRREAGATFTALLLGSLIGTLMTVVLHELAEHSGRN